MTDIRTVSDLAHVVRGRRIELELSQDELAARAAVSRKWVNEFEAGKPAAELRIVLSVLDALDLDLEVASRAGAIQTDDAQIDLDALIDDYQEG